MKLADVIITAFGFDNDHAHAFFMDNKSWSKEDCYYMREVDFDMKFRHTNDHCIYELALQEGDLFRFVFDFGDDWTFQCKVIGIEDEDTKKPELLRSVGEAPEQYPNEEYM